MDAPNFQCNGLPQMLVQHWNVLSFSWSTGRGFSLTTGRCDRGFSWTIGRCDLVWCRNMATLTIWFQATLRAFAHRDDMETWELSQSGSQQNGCPLVESDFILSQVLSLPLLGDGSCSGPTVNADWKLCNDSLVWWEWCLFCIQWWGTNNYHQRKEIRKMEGGK